jgi:drug/metabolite transporter (DMT)-like permease
MKSAGALPATRERLILGKLALVALIWAASFTAGRIAVAAMTPQTAGVWRYVIASVALVVALLALEGRIPRLTPKQGVGIVLLGATGVYIYNLCFLYGIQTVPGSRAALIVALNPVFVALGAWLLLGHRLAPLKALGTALALLGAATVISHGDFVALVRGNLGRGEMLLVACTFSWVAYTLIGTRMLAGMSPLVATTYAAIAGTVMLTVTAAGTEGLALPPATLAAWGSLAFLGVLTTAVAFVWYYEGVKVIGPARAGVFINLVPVMAVVLGVLLLGESLDVATVVGGAITVAGVFLLNRPTAAERIAAKAPRASAPCA